MMYKKCILKGRKKKGFFRLLYAFEFQKGVPF